MAKMMVYVLAAFCGLLHSTAAVPVTTVAPGARSSQTVTEVLRASLQKTRQVLDSTTEALGLINTVHFGGTGSSYDDYNLGTLPSPDEIITAQQIETSALEDSVVLETLKSQLHIFERHLERVKLDELELDQQDVYEKVALAQTKTTELQTSLAVTANTMGHPLDSTNEQVYIRPCTSEYCMTLRAYVTFRDYEIFLGHLDDVFAQLLLRES